MTDREFPGSSVYRAIADRSRFTFSVPFFGEGGLGGLDFPLARNWDSGGFLYGIVGILVNPCESFFLKLRG